MTIAEWYKTIVGVDVDKHILCEWEKTASPESDDIDAFKGFIMKSIAYRNHITNLFKNEYYDLVDANLQLVTIRNFQKHIKGSIIGKTEVSSYIKNLPIFNDKCTKVIRDIFGRCTNIDKSISNPSQADLDFYIQKFKKNTEPYTIDLLYQDIIDEKHKIEGREENGRDDVNSNTINTMEAEEPKQTKSSRQTKNIKRPIAYTPSNINLTPTLDITADTPTPNPTHIPIPATPPFHSHNDSHPHPREELSYKSGETSIRDLDIKGSYSRTRCGTHTDQDTIRVIQKPLIVAFETVFNRPMFVHEYFKIIIERRLVFENQDEMNTHFKCIFQKFMSDFNKTRKILADYTNITLQEYDFVKQFLYGVDDDSFFVNLIDDIVKGGCYKREMIKVLSHQYKEMFNEELQSHDVSYLFAKVIVKKLSLHDEHITHILESLKRETNEIIDHVSAKFLQVIHRHPDVFETQEHIQMYRSQLDARVSQRQFESLSAKELEEHLVNIDQSTEHLLIESLEFHDIIKQKIRSINPKIQPRYLFEILQKMTNIIVGQTLEYIDEKVKELMLENNS